jgi:hypothetical protein
MPTTFDESTDPVGGSITHNVNESVKDVTDDVNAALSSNLKYVTFTHADDGKQFSVEARDVRNIRET